MASTPNPMTREDLTAWLRLHCDPSVEITEQLVDDFSCFELDELEEMADRAHGSMA